MGVVLDVPWITVAELISFSCLTSLLLLVFLSLRMLREAVSLPRAEGTFHSCCQDFI